jgi:hypothetical protein
VQVFWQVALVFGLIAVLSLVLRWVFSPPRAYSRDPALPRRRPRRLFRRRGGQTDGEQGALRPSASPISPAATPRIGVGSIGTSKHPADDYGLLAVAAETGTAEEAATVRRLLTEAGIRSSSAVTGGRHKVLVFGHELMRARRVAGGAQGGTGGAQGAGSS